MPQWFHWATAKKYISILLELGLHLLGSDQVIRSALTNELKSEELRALHQFTGHGVLQGHIDYSHMMQLSLFHTTVQIQGLCWVTVHHGQERTVGMLGGQGQGHSPSPAAIVHKREWFILQQRIQRAG